MDEKALSPDRCLISIWLDCARGRETAGGEEKGGEGGSEQAGEIAEHRNVSGRETASRCETTRPYRGPRARNEPDSVEEREEAHGGELVTWRR